MQAINEKLDSRTTLDYVRLLPIELWREIFQLALPPASTPVLSPTTFFYGDILPTDRKYLRQLQRHRAQMRVVCKMLEPIVLESLLEGVIFYSEWIPRFLYALEKMRSETWDPAVLVRRVTILFSDILDDPTTATRYSQLAQLYAHCPNLKSIKTFICFHGPNRPRAIDIEWTHNVTEAIFQLPFLSTGCLVGLSTQNPELETLALFAEKPENLEVTLQTKVTFPNLKRLFLSDNSAFTDLSCPELEWLGFTLFEPSNTGLRSFLWSNCGGLTHLHLKVTWLSHMEIPWILYLLYLCPRLNTLSLQGHSIANYGVDPREPHSTLKHLILRCESPYEVSLWLEMFGFLIDCEPLLSFTTITIQLVGDYRRARVRFERDKAATLENIELMCGKLDSTFLFEEMYSDPPQP